MKMAANSNMNFHPHHLHHHHKYHPATTSTSSSAAAAAASGGSGVFPASFYNDQYVVCFQSGAINSSDGMMMMRGESSSPSNKSSSAPAAVAGPPSPLAAVGSMVAGLKHDTGLAVDWSFHEQALLNDALIKFAGEPGTMKYIKIAALLPDKTVRDVALRCRWMSKEHVKRRKIEENYAAKKILNRKEQMLNSHMKGNIHSLQPVNIVAHSFMLHPSNQNNQFSYEAPVIDGATQQLMEENVQIISQISDNLSAFKLQDNIDLFSRTSKNITAILNRMSEMPGIMSKMPPLPVSIDEDLMNYILPIASQAPMFGMPSGMSMKLEPR